VSREPWTGDTEEQDRLHMFSTFYINLRGFGFQSILAPFVSTSVVTCVRVSKSQSFCLFTILDTITWIMFIPSGSQLTWDSW
jgi:hypothetical protein